MRKNWILVALLGGVVLCGRATAGYAAEAWTIPMMPMIQACNGAMKPTPEQINEEIAAASKALLLAPQDTNAYVRRGIAYRDQGDRERAIAEFSQAIFLDPKNADAYYNRGRDLKALGRKRWAEAKSDLAMAISLDPKNAKVHYVLGDIMIGENDIQGALAEYTQAIEIDPNYEDAYYSRGTLYGILLNRYEEGERDLKKAISLNETDACAQNNLGDNYLRRGMYDKAMSQFNKAIAIDPKFSIAYANRAIIHRLRKQHIRHYYNTWRYRTTSKH